MTAKTSKRKSIKRKSPKRKSAKRKSSKRKATRSEQSAGARKPVAVRTKRAGGRGPSAAKSADARGWRLPLDVRPTSMDIALEVDPTVSPRYRGEVGINLQLAKRRDRIELHAADMRVSRARIRVGGETFGGKATLHPERETVEIAFAKPIPPGHARLELAFSARLRTDLCGLYAVDVGGRKYAFSQLAATHARRFVPCFDEPAMKARFRINVTTGQQNDVLSNTSIESEEILDDGRKCVRFRPTPPLSSYLLAVAVGKLEASTTSMCGAVPIRVWHVPGRGNMAAFGLEVARESLLRLEAYFGIPYPYEKLDLVAVPDFEFGAMENPGAVFFRETLLLLDTDSASSRERKRAAEVICHELAHMWYGDLVTMAWWDDLWLNEAFATWMAFAIVDQWRPEWRMWQTFQHRRAAALDADALANTHPIYTPVRSADEALQNFDLITYEKGAAVIRMVERQLGADTFRDGVRLYMRRHRESNAVAADLWGALSEVSGEKVERFVRPWLEQAGHPIVSIERGEREGLGVVTLRQERMRVSPVRASTQRAGGAAAKWPIPILGRVGSGLSGETRTVRHTLTRRRESIPAQGADLTFIYANAEEAGFYRPHHAVDLLRDLVEEIGELSPIERQGLVDHQWALVRSGDAALAGLMDLLAALGTETDPDVLGAARTPLFSLSKRLAPDAAPSCEARLRAWVEVYFGGQVDALGWTPAGDEDEDTRMRRAEILTIVGVIGESSAVIEEARARCDALLAGNGELDPNLTDTVVTIAARNGDAALHDRMLAAMRDARTPQECHRYMFGLAAFRERDLIERTLALCLSGDIAMQDVSFLLTRLFDNRHAAVPTWSFVKRRWGRLRKSLPPQLSGRLIAATPALLTRAYRDEVTEFFGRNALPGTERPLRQAVERFDWYAKFRTRTAPQLEAYLTG